MYFGHITLSLAECLMHFFITNLIYGHVLLSPMSKYNEIKQKFNILYDVVIKTFTENWDSKVLSVGTLLAYLETMA